MENSWELSSKLADSVCYLLGLDPTPCHTGWALYDRADGQFTYGVFEPPKTVTEDLPRMEYMLEEVFGLLPPDPGFDAKTIFVVIEGLAFNGRGSYALQLAGLGYMLRREFRNREIAYREVAPTQAKKFLTGKGNCDKNLILKEVFKRYQIDVDDDNIADAVNFNMIGRALLSWNQPSNQAQASVIEALNAGPKPKKTRKSKAA
jgi:Holliday junction resolvasome RuvABC endonuclease subunit